MSATATMVERPPPQARGWPRRRIIGYALVGLWIAFGLGIVSYLVFAWNAAFFAKYAPAYLQGLGVTLSLVAISMVLGAILSVPVAYGRMSGNRILSGLALARLVAIVSGKRWALMHELRGEDEPTLEAILSRLAPADIVVVEGYKREAHRKIETRRMEAKDRTPLSASDPNIVAIASDFAIESEGLPVFDLDDTKSIADFVERTTGLVA